MNTVVFSILRLCPPVPGARAALLYVGGRPAINWRLFGRGGTPPRIPRAMGRRHGKGSMPPLECRSWEASGRSPRRRQPGLHRRARARRRRRTLLRPVASLRPRSRGVVASGL